jgi:hypothetical protein
MLFEKLFKQSAWPSLDETFAIPFELLINKRNEEVEEERYLLRGILFNPSSAKKVEEVSSYLLEKQELFLSVNSEELEQFNLTTFELRENIVIIQSQSYVISEVSTVDSVSFQFKLVNTKHKEIGDRGRREY